jgi:glutamate synthase (NADPH/NADH) large chain
MPQEVFTKRRSSRDRETKPVIVPKIPQLPTCAIARYDPRLEKDSCGVGFIADMKNRKSHSIVAQGLQILENLEHRGAVGADPQGRRRLRHAGADPARASSRKECAKLGFDLPEPASTPFSSCSCRATRPGRKIVQKIVDKTIKADEGQKLLGWRDVPVDNAGLGEAVKPTEPVHRQVFIGRGDAHRRGRFRAPPVHPAQGDLGRSMTSTIRRRRAITPSRCPAARWSTRACSSPTQLGAYYRTCTTRASNRRWRWSTSASRPTPSRPGRWPTPTGWSPQRRDQHPARQRQLDGGAAGLGRFRTVRRDISKLWPISYPGQSDTACFDNALEFLCGRLFARPCDDDADPEAWAGNPLMDEERRAFYEYTPR